MKQTFENGYQKRKRKHQLENELKTLSKFGRSFTSRTEDNSQTQGDKQNPKQQLPTDHSVSAADVAKSTSTLETTTFTKLSDIGQWVVLTEDELSYWILKGPSECRH
ncbi:UNVERIFIED_CONTAM: hypothetical protein RMT77_011801 [Armadillidium vulgare]